MFALLVSIEQMAAVHALHAKPQLQTVLNVLLTLQIMLHVLNVMLVLSLLETNVLFALN